MQRKVSPRQRVIIVGAGFGGIEVARALGSGSADVTLIDRRNYHLFQPLLYQVATAVLSPADIAEPARRMLHYRNVTVMFGEVVSVSVNEKCVALAGGEILSYNILVVAAGAVPDFFGHDDWKSFAPSLKSIADARAIRSRLLRAFEEAESSHDAAEKKRLMTFVIVGAGPSGVELAGSIAELARDTLARDFHSIDPGSATVLLLEAGPRILASFPEGLARYARRKLTELGVTVRENCAVKNISCDRVDTASGEIPNGLTIWTAGVKASPLGEMLGVATGKSGRIKANRDLSVPGLANVYVLGDIALVEGRDGKPLPGLAQVAKQQGCYLGKVIARATHGEKRVRDFEFHDRGNVAVIGRHAAIVDFGWVRLTGMPARMLWALVHIYLLAGLQHRMLVAMQWAWHYMTYDRGARLIVEAPERDKGC